MNKIITHKKKKKKDLVRGKRSFFFFFIAMKLLAELGIWQLADGRPICQSTNTRMPCCLLGNLALSDSTLKSENNTSERLI